MSLRSQLSSLTHRADAKMMLLVALLATLVALHGTAAFDTYDGASGLVASKGSASRPAAVVQRFDGTYACFVTAAHRPHPLSLSRSNARLRVKCFFRVFSLRLFLKTYFLLTATSGDM